MQFFVLVNGEQQGPFTPDQIKGYLAMGQFQHSDLAWHEGLPDWKPLGEFPDFAPKTHRTPNYKSVPVRNLTQRKTKGGKGWIGAVAGLVILAAAGAGGYYFWQQRQQAKNAPAPAPPEPLAGTAGEPKTLEEMNRWYEEPPAGQNAATFFEQGFALLQITNADRNSASLPLIGKAAMPSIVSPVSTGVKNTIRSFLERNKPAMELFERGAQCSGSRYPLDMTKGFDLLLPHVTKVRQAAQLAGLNALIQADSRQGTNAAQSVLLALAAARTMEAEPILISQLTRAACEGIAADALEQTFNRAALPAESLTRLQTAFDRAAEYESSGAGFNRAFVMERVNGLAYFGLPPEKLREQLSRVVKGTNSLREIPSNLSNLSETALANLKEQRQFFEEAMNQMLAARKEPLPGRLKADETITSRAEEAKSKQYALVGMLLPALGRVTSREAAALARLRLAQTAIALERFRAANTGRFPEALTELAPTFFAAVHNDPFDGQPLRYRKAGEGYLLYSVGPDLKDDNGMRQAGSDDLTFVVARPPRL